MNEFSAELYRNRYIWLCSAENSSANAIARFEYANAKTGVGERRCGGKACCTGAENNHIEVWRALLVSHVETEVRQLLLSSRSLFDEVRAD
jgi:hypothetical protein